MTIRVKNSIPERTFHERQAEINEYRKKRRKEITEEQAKSPEERIFLYRNGQIISFGALTKEEKLCVSNNVCTRLADSLMAAKGYTRVKDDNE